MSVLSGPSEHFPRQTGIEPKEDQSYIVYRMPKRAKSLLHLNAGLTASFEAVGVPRLRRLTYFRHTASHDMSLTRGDRESRPPFYAS